MSLRKLSTTDWTYESTIYVDSRREVDVTVDIEANKRGVDINGHTLPWQALDAAREAIGLQQWSDEDFEKWAKENGWAKVPTCPLCQSPIPLTGRYRSNATNEDVCSWDCVIQSHKQNGAVSLPIPTAQDGEEDEG